MSYTDLFHHGTTADLNRYIHITKPSALGSIKDVQYYYNRAAEYISDADKLIETMKEYQLALSARYQEICATNYKLFLLCKRNICYDNTKTYTITISKVFEDKSVSDEVILSEKYEGRERHKALKRFEELKKEYPSIENELDIEKRHWER